MIKTTTSVALRVPKMPVGPQVPHYMLSANYNDHFSPAPSPETWLMPKPESMSGRTGSVPTTSKSSGLGFKALARSISSCHQPLLGLAGAVTGVACLIAGAATGNSSFNQPAVLGLGLWVAAVGIPSR
jgi:hypothetical protein